MKKKQNLRKRLNFLLMKVAATTVGFAFSFTATSLALAEPIPIENYCISKVGPKKESKVPSSNTDALRVDFTVENARFHINKDKDGYLGLFDADNNRLSKIFPAHRLEEIFLTKTGWLLMNYTFGDNYLAKVELAKNPPSMSKPMPLTELKSGRCSRFARFIEPDGCFVSGGYYSHSLDRIFVTGRELTLLGTSSLRTIEIVDGKIKPFPLEKPLGYVLEAPKLKGIIFFGESHDFYFYDGHTVITLLDDYINRKPQAEIARTPILKTPLTNRFFIHSVLAPGAQGKPFLVEVMPDLKLRPVSTSVSGDIAGLDVFDFPNDERVFGLTGRSIVAEINGKLTVVASLKEPYSFWRTPENFWQNSDGTLAFSARKKFTDIFSEYFLTRSSSTTKCHMPLSAGKVIMLDPESPGEIIDSP